MRSYADVKARWLELREWAKARGFFVCDDPKRQDSFYGESPIGAPNRFTIEMDDRGDYDIVIHRSDQPNAPVNVFDSPLSWVQNNWFPTVSP